MQNLFPCFGLIGFDRFRLVYEQFRTVYVFWVAEFKFRKGCKNLRWNKTKSNDFVHFLVRGSPGPIPKLFVRRWVAWFRQIYAGFGWFRPVYCFGLPKSDCEEAVRTFVKTIRNLTTSDTFRFRAARDQFQSLFYNSVCWFSLAFARFRKV